MTMCMKWCGVKRRIIRRDTDKKVSLFYWSL
nr:MAG TPA: hypothetical protein [Caudoviricetes sp.]